MAVFPALQGGPHNHQCLACRNPRELLTTTRPRCSDRLVETQKNPSLRSTSEGSQIWGMLPLVCSPQDRCPGCSAAGGGDGQPNDEHEFEKTAHNRLESLNRKKM